MRGLNIDLSLFFFFCHLGMFDYLASVNIDNSICLSSGLMLCKTFNRLFALSLEKQIVLATQEPVSGACSKST